MYLYRQSRKKYLKNNNPKNSLFFNIHTSQTHDRYHFVVTRKDYAVSVSHVQRYDVNYLKML